MWVLLAPCVLVRFYRLVAYFLTCLYGHAYARTQKHTNECTKARMDTTIHTVLQEEISDSDALNDRACMKYVWLRL